MNAQQAARFFPGRLCVIRVTQLALGNAQGSSQRYWDRLQLTTGAGGAQGLPQALRSEVRNGDAYQVRA